MPLAHIIEREGSLAAYLFKSICGEVDPSRFTFGLHSCSHIHAITKDVITINDYIANINAYAEDDAGTTVSVSSTGVVAIRHRLLHSHRAVHGIDGAGELQQHPVTRGLDDATVVRGNRRINQLAPMRFQCLQRSDLVHTHQTAVADDICR